MLNLVEDTNLPIDYKLTSVDKCFVSRLLFVNFGILFFFAKLNFSPIKICIYSIVWLLEIWILQCNVKVFLLLLNAKLSLLLRVYIENGFDCKFRYFWIILLILNLAFQCKLVWLLNLFSCAFMDIVIFILLQITSWILTK